MPHDVLGQFYHNCAGPNCEMRLYCLDCHHVGQGGGDERNIYACRAHSGRYGEFLSTFFERSRNNSVLDLNWRPAPVRTRNSKCRCNGCRM